MSDEITRLPVRLKDTEKVVQVVHYSAACRHRRAVVDQALAELTCADCGVKLNPIAFLAGLAATETFLKNQMESVASARAALEEKSRCRCTKCGEWTPIRRVGKRELTRIGAVAKAKANAAPPEGG